MIRASVVPYLSGMCGVVIAEGDAPPLRLLAARAFEVGALVDLPPEQQTPHHTKTRRVDVEDIGAAAERVMVLLMEHEVSLVALDSPAGPSTFDARARSLAVEVQILAAETGIVVEVRQRPKMTPWPSTSTSAERSAAALLLASLGAAPLAPHGAPEPRDPVQARELGRELTVTPPRRLAELVEPYEWTPGRRVITVDPGSRWIGVSIVVGDVAPLVVETCATLEVDAKDWPAVVAVARELARLAVAHGCTLAVVERSVNLYLAPTMGAAGGAARGTRLLRSGEVGAAVALALALAGLDVRRPSAAQWRAGLVGTKVKGEARSGAIGVAVASAIVGGLPAGDDAHVRDALGMGAWVALPPPAPRAAPLPRAPRAPGAKRDRTNMRRPKLDRERAAVADEKRAAGCKCRKGARHRSAGYGADGRSPCPLFVPVPKRKGGATA